MMFYVYFLQSGMQNLKNGKKNVKGIYKTKRRLRLRITEGFLTSKQLAERYKYRIMIIYL